MNLNQVKNEKDHSSNKDTNSNTQNTGRDVNSRSNSGVPDVEAILDVSELMRKQLMKDNNRLSTVVEGEGKLEDTLGTLLDTQYERESP